MRSVIYPCEDLGSLEVWHVLVTHQGWATVLRVEFVPQPWSDGLDFVEHLAIVDDLDDLPDHLVVSLPL